MLRIPARAGAFLAIVIWGTSFVATKVALEELPPVALVMTRTVLGAVFLAALLALRRRRILPPRDALRALAVMGAIGVAFHQLLQAWGLSLTSATNTGWLIGL